LVLNEELESEEKYKAIFEEATDGILVADIKTKKFMLANPKILEITGYLLKELLKLDVNKIHPKKDLPYVLDQFKKQTQGKITLAKNIPVLRKDKKIIYCDVNSKIIKIRGQKLMLGLFRDITERKRVEEEIKNSENKYRTLVENIPQKIFLKDNNSVYISCNENYARDLKIKPDEIIGKTDYDFYPKKLAEKYRKDDKRIMKSRKMENIEEEYIQDGKKVFVNTIKVPIRNEKENVIGLLGVFWDITDKKKAEEEIKKARDELQSKVEELERFNKLSVGRELKMIELKNRIKELEEKLNKK
jgi:PAS domain S-box-containing protein